MVQIITMQSLNFIWLTVEFIKKKKKKLNLRSFHTFVLGLARERQPECKPIERSQISMIFIKPMISQMKLKFWMVIIWIISFLRIFFCCHSNNLTFWPRLPLVSPAPQKSPVYICQYDVSYIAFLITTVPILRPTPVIVQGLCSVIFWYSPAVPCSEVSGYDVRLYSPQSGQQNVTRRVGANGTFYIIKDEDILAGSGETYVQVHPITSCLVLYTIYYMYHAVLYNHHNVTTINSGSNHSQR